MFEVERTMQPLAILQAQSVSFLRDLLAALPKAFTLTGPITFLGSLLGPPLILRPRLCRALALRVAILFALTLGARPVFTLTLLLRPLPVRSALWFCPPIWFALVLWLRSSIGLAARTGRFSAIAMLRLIAVRSVQLAAWRGAWPMRAAPARSARPVRHAASAGGATRSMCATSPGPTLPTATAFVRLS
jgi:hypothetical protein